MTNQIPNTVSKCVQKSFTCAISASCRIAIIVLGVLWFGEASACCAELAKPAGVRMFTCGHSFHVFVYRMLPSIAKSAGIEDHQPVGLSAIGGSRVIQHWDVPEEKNLARAALAAGKVDVLTLSPIWLPDDGIARFAKLGHEHNPSIRVLVQEYWLPNDTYEPIYPLDVRKGINHNETKLADLRDAQGRYRRDLETAVQAINDELKAPVIRIVPVGLAAVALREKLAAGKVPGLTQPWDLFRDSWGHAEAPLMVLSGYCHYAVIYGQSPVGLPVPVELSRYRRLTTDVLQRRPRWRPTPDDLAKAIPLTEEEQAGLNRVLQEVAWEAVQENLK